MVANQCAVAAKAVSIAIDGIFGDEGVGRSIHLHATEGDGATKLVVEGVADNPVVGCGILSRVFAT